MNNVFANALTLELDENPKPELGKIYSSLSEIPDGHFAHINADTGEVMDMGDAASMTASVLYEEDQKEIGDGKATSHVVDFSSLYDLLNSEPSVAQSGALFSELPVAYGYYFRYPPEITRGSSILESRLNQQDTGLWDLWASYIQLTHVTRQALFSLKFFGNVWIEKTYDTSGLNKLGWGVKKLRVLSPDAMFNVVNEEGDILYFIQWAGASSRTMKSKLEFDKQKDKDRYNRLRKSRVISEDDADFLEKHLKTGQMKKFERHQIVYANYNAYFDDTVYGFGSLVPLISYARSKIGIQKRLLRMVENTASSFVIFKYGSEEYRVSGKAANKVTAQIGKGQNPKFMVLPFFFETETVEMGKSMQNIEYVLDFFREEQLYGSGLPPFMSGKAGTDAGADMQMEMMVRQMKYLQKVISDIYRKQLFPEVLLGDPATSPNIATEPAEEYPYMTPQMFLSVPVFDWFEIESVADQRLRHQVYSQEGILGREEIRKETGYSNDITDDQLSPDNRAKLREVEQKDRELDMRDKELDIMKTQGDEKNRIEEKKADKPPQQPSIPSFSKPSTSSSSDN